MNPAAKIFSYGQPFSLENGTQLPEVEITYHTYGKLNSEKNNVIWVCHALTANSDVFSWWPGLFGEKDLFNSTDYFIVCANNLGSCYGTTGPLSVNPYTKDLWFSHFPEITIRDMVNAHDLLRQFLEIEKIEVLIGGSQGGQQVLEWNVKTPSLINNTVVIATNAKHSPWAIAFNESQRLAIKADRTYYGHTTDGGKKGLAAARSIALLSYRNYNTYHEKQQNHQPGKTNDFNASSYQRYQGEKLAGRFNAYSYVTLTNAMDSHDLSKNASSVEQSLNKITAHTLVIGISGDLLFPPEEQVFLAKHIEGSTCRLIESLYGHDGFLLETPQLSKIISDFLYPIKHRAAKQLLQINFKRLKKWQKN